MSGPGGGGGAAARAAEAAAHLGGQLACWEQVRRRALGAAAAGGERIEGCGMPGAAVGILRAGAQRPAPNGLAVPAPGGISSSTTATEPSERNFGKVKLHHWHNGSVVHCNAPAGGSTGAENCAQWCNSHGPDAHKFQF
jgi:hypothetical protein